MNGTAFILLVAALGDWEMAGPSNADDWEMVPVAVAVAPAKPPQPIQSSPRYPVHSQRWNIDGNWNPSNAYLLAHLKSGQHAGKWDHAWLSTLTRAELLSLHDDDHEGRVHWGNTRRPQAPVQASAPAAVRPIPVTPQQTRGRGLFGLRPARQSNCPGGYCPR